MTWIYLKTKEETETLEHSSTSNDFLRVNWEGEGWYFQRSVKKRCPRGCCFDYGTEWTPARRIVYETNQKIKDLAVTKTKLETELTEAKLKEVKPNK